MTHPHASGKEYQRCITCQPLFYSSFLFSTLWTALVFCLFVCFLLLPTVGRLSLSYYFCWMAHASLPFFLFFFALASARGRECPYLCVCEIGEAWDLFFSTLQCWGIRAQQGGILAGRAKKVVGSGCSSSRRRQQRGAWQQQLCSPLMPLSFTSPLTTTLLPCIQK